MNKYLIYILNSIVFAWRTFKDTKVVKIDDYYSIRKGWLFYRYFSRGMDNQWWWLDEFNHLRTKDINEIGAYYDRLMTPFGGLDYGKTVYLERYKDDA